jgi:hypothetical protein
VVVADSVSVSQRADATHMCDCLALYLFRVRWSLYLTNKIYSDIILDSSSALLYLSVYTRADDKFLPIA